MVLGGLGWQRSGVTKGGIEREMRRELMDGSSWDWESNEKLKYEIGGNRLR